MKMTFLGTGTSMGVPVLTCNCQVCQSEDARDKRLRCSALLQTKHGKYILLDIGPDFRSQMFRANVPRIDAILVTHAHRDHVAGIDDVRPYNYVQRAPLDMYANEQAACAIMHDYHYIFEPHQYAGLPEITMHTVRDEECLEVAGECVVPVRAMHKDLPVLAYRIGRVGYVTDVSYIAAEELQKLVGVDVLVVNALRKQKHYSHFCLTEALHVIEQVSPRCAYLTHVSHEMGLHAEVSTDGSLPSNVYLAYDGLEVSVKD